MHPRSLGLRGGGASPQRCYVGVRLVLSAHNHVVVGWPTTSFGTLKLLPTKGGTAVGRAQGDTRGVAKCVGKSREENANKHRGCLLLAKGETTMGRASVVARGREANKHRGVTSHHGWYSHGPGKERTPWVFANHHGWYGRGP